MEGDDHKVYHRRILYVILVMLIVLFGGATFYHYVERWRYLDALYFAAATITTVGYGDITPHTDGGKIVTIIYVFTGVGIALYGLSLLASHFVEMREEFWLRKIGKLKIQQRTRTFWTKLKDLFTFQSDKFVQDDGDKKKIKK